MKNELETQYLTRYLRDLAEYELTPSDLEDIAQDICRYKTLSLSIEEIEKAVSASLQNE